jgi:hypothetical protein
VRTVAEEYARVVGVDTHAATRTMTLLIGATGAVVEHRTFPTSAAGLRRALTWIRNRTQDQACLVVVEGTGSYGAGWPSISPRAGSSSPRPRPSPRRDPVARTTPWTRPGSPGLCWVCGSISCAGPGPAAPGPRSGCWSPRETDGHRAR